MTFWRTTHNDPRDEWHDWFAWFPVDVDFRVFPSMSHLGTAVAWFETVGRKRERSGYYSYRILVKRLR